MVLGGKVVAYERGTPAPHPTSRPSHPITSSGTASQPFITAVSTAYRGRTSHLPTSCPENGQANKPRRAIPTPGPHRYLAHKNHPRGPCSRPPMMVLQGYLAHKKTHHPRTLQWDYAESPTVALGTAAISYGRETPAVATLPTPSPHPPYTLLTPSLHLPYTLPTPSLHPLYTLPTPSLHPPDTHLWASDAGSGRAFVDELSQFLAPHLTFQTVRAPLPILQPPRVLDTPTGALDTPTGALKTPNGELHTPTCVLDTP